MIKRPTVTMKTSGGAINSIHCGECNWKQLIISENNNEIKCCPWCGWGDLEISKLEKNGGYQIINCEEHGNITVIIPNEEIEPDDFMDNLFCPFCE